MRDFRRVITSAFLALATWTATVNPSQADSGTVRVIFGTAGVVAGERVLEQCSKQCLSTV
jgi:hypothetical protein